MREKAGGMLPGLDSPGWVEAGALLAEALSLHPPMASVRARECSSGRLGSSHLKCTPARLVLGSGMLALTTHLRAHFPGCLAFQQGGQYSRRKHRGQPTGARGERGK